MERSYALPPAAYRMFSVLHSIVFWLLLLVLALLWLNGLGPGAWREPAAKAPAPSAPAAPAPAPTSAPPPAPATASAPTGAAPTAAPAVTSSPSPPEAVAPAAAAAPPASPASSPSAAEAPPSVRLYFAAARHALPRDAAAQLAPIVAYLEAHADAKVALSGYHDASGPRAKNVELAKRRAAAVRAALVKAGVAPARIILDKPVQTTGSGASREARRVEVEIVR